LFSTLRLINFKADDTMALLLRCPELLTSNRHLMVQKKIDLLRSLKLNDYEIKHFIKDYPFVLLK